jgi:hypothetical protein
MLVKHGTADPWQTCFYVALCAWMNNLIPQQPASGIPSSRLTVPARYYFNLTDGDATIRDEEGVEVSNIQAAVIHALEVIEELRAEDPSNSAEWQGWRLEIIDSSGKAVQSIPLDAPSVH